MQNLHEKIKKAIGAAVTEPVNLFFKEHNENGYFHKPDLIDYVCELDENQIEHLTNLFKYTRIKCKIVNAIKPKMDPKTQEFIIWVHIELPKGKLKLPIPHHEGMLKFIEDYQQTNIWFEADLESLLSEAGLTFTNV